MVADFRCLPKVSVPGQPVFTRASFVINDRERGLTQVADHPPVTGLRRSTKSDAERTRETLRQETRAP